MEELQSTESLEKEILDEARKKAEKLVQNAEQSIKESQEKAKKNVDSRISAEKQRLSSKLSEGLNEIDTSMALGKRRIYLNNINKLIANAVSKYFASISRKETLSLLQKELKKRFLFIFDDNFTARESQICITYRSLQKSELLALLQDSMPESKKTLFDWTKTNIVEAGRQFLMNGILPAIVVDFGSIRITAALDIAAGEMLKEKRKELITTLFGDKLIGQFAL